MANEKTPIEVLADSCEHGMEVDIQEVLVPEQCMMATIGDKVYHVTVEEMEEAAVKGYNDKPATAPVGTSFSELRKAVCDMEARFCVEVRSWKDHENACYTNFEVLSSDMASRVIVLCRATGLEDLFDQLAPWQGGDGLDWEQKALVVRALKAAAPVAECLDLNLTPEFECGEYLPKIYIQMSC